jgi:hypothetical protein
LSIRALSNGLNVLFDHDPNQPVDLGHLGVQRTLPPSATRSFELFPIVPVRSARYTGVVMRLPSLEGRITAAM